MRGVEMFPSIKKNLFNDKVENSKSSVSIKGMIVGLLLGGCVAFGSTTLPTTDTGLNNTQSIAVQDTFILKPTTSTMSELAYHSSHRSHGSHHSHYSSRY
jgi:hypothetical protein